MTDPRPDANDALDDALRDLIATRLAGSPGAGLEARILAQASSTRQRRGWTFLPPRWSGAWPSTPEPRRVVALGSIALVAVIASALIGTALLAPHAGTSGPVGTGTTGTISPTPTDGPTPVPLRPGGVCPVTPITRVVGGTAPEVDVSGLRWRWGGVPWIAGVDQKVVWLADAGDTPQAGISVFATQLDFPILVDGQPLSGAGSAGGDLYAATVTDAGWIDLIRLPRAGCWLLTAIWSQGASSVVVAAAPPPGTAGSVNAPPGPSASSTPLAVCPATAPSAGFIPDGWSGGPAYLDGPFSWLLPSSQNWRIGPLGDKLVLDSYLGWGAAGRRVIGVPLVHATGVGWLDRQASIGDTPPISAGTMGVGMTLLARGCWAFVYLDAATTSTIVEDVSLNAVTPSPAPVASPAVTCGDLAAADCAGASIAALTASTTFVGRTNPVIRVDLGRGVWCPTPGLLFADTTCPDAALPPPGGGQWIGHALVTFAGSPDQAYINIARNGAAVRGVVITLATPPPASPSLF